VKNKVFLYVLAVFLSVNLYTFNYNFKQETNLLEHGCLMEFDDGSKLIGTIDISCTDTTKNTLDILLRCYLNKENNNNLTASFCIIPYFKMVDSESYEEELIKFLLQRKEIIAIMLDKVEHECKKLGVTKIYTFVINHRDILSFYQRHGFFESYFDKLYRLSYLRKLYLLLTDEWALINSDSIKLQKSI